jgi:MgsA AAA+ ATPase C terminal
MQGVSEPEPPRPLFVSVLEAAAAAAGWDRGHHIVTLEFDDGRLRRWGTTIRVTARASWPSTTPTWWWSSTASPRPGCGSQTRTVERKTGARSVSVRATLTTGGMEPEHRERRFGELLTPGGYRNDEAASALQKAIRRGEEEQALFWASELDLAGYGAYVWKRLRIIASEDVGLADPEAVLLTRALYENWLDQRKADRAGGNPLNASMFLVHAVIVLARAGKSRLVDHALAVTYLGERPAREVPDWALDKHTERGRRMGRGLDHFFTEGATLANERALPDPYRGAARAVSPRPARRKEVVNDQPVLPGTGPDQ